jgi:hypothetical protein
MIFVMVVSGRILPSIAGLQKLIEFLLICNFEKRFLWSQIGQDGLIATQQILDVVQCPPALAIPKHDPTGCPVSHRFVLYSVVLEVLHAAITHEHGGLPLADIVATALHAEDHDPFVSANQAKLSSAFFLPKLSIRLLALLGAHVDQPRSAV